jgi:hypothetical protein
MVADRVAHPQRHPPRSSRLKKVSLAGHFRERVAAGIVGNPLIRVQASPENVLLYYSSVQDEHGPRYAAEFSIRIGWWGNAVTAPAPQKGVFCKRDKL